MRATGSLKRTSAKGLTNAILRGFLRRRDVLLADAERDPESRFSYPRWWIDRVHSEYPGRAAEILDAGNARPPLTLRVNPEVARILKSREGVLISELEALTRKDIVIKSDSSVHQERFEIF